MEDNIKDSMVKSFGFKIFLLIMLTIVTASGLTFGFYFTGKSQTGENEMNTLSCFDISFTDENSIKLNKALPVSDDDGQTSNPYTFTIKNNCDETSKYYVILNVKSGSFEERFIDLTLDKGSINKGADLLTNTQFEIPNGYNRSYIITGGVLEGQKEKTHEMRIWLDKDTTYEDVKGKTWEAQVKVVSVAQDLDKINS